MTAATTTIALKDADYLDHALEDHIRALVRFTREQVAAPDSGFVWVGGLTAHTLAIVVNERPDMIPAAGRDMRFDFEPPGADAYYDGPRLRVQAMLDHAAWRDGAMTLTYSLEDSHVH